MVEAADNLVLELLRAIRGDVSRTLGRLDEHGHRLARIELGLAGQRRDQANDAEAIAEMGVRYDQLVSRLERVETRLGLVDDAP